ncbi:Uncharacterized protein APZ42_026369 [Daphnia magna]|uniref:Uncharacterized protein n=1 Tax=Daphnia magna TaxID=35525 RepID=A0A164SAH2_9CRUS|nr:Uncharacterized protein APZ42_026369 [Daphnia magna]
MSDKIRSPAEDTVYRSFERALENNNLHSLWVGLDRVVPKEVFRRLGLREPFPRPASAPSKPKISPPARFAPYARPADQDLKFLNDKERAELEAGQKGPSSHANTLTFLHRTVASSLFICKPVPFADKSEALLPPSPLACQPPAVTCKPATEPDPRSLHFTATKSNTLRPYPLLSPTRPNRIRPCSSPIRRTAVPGLTSASPT